MDTKLNNSIVENYDWPQLVLTYAILTLQNPSKVRFYIEWTGVARRAQTFSPVLYSGQKLI